MMTYIILAIKLYIAYQVGGFLSAGLILVIFCNDDDLFNKCIMDFDKSAEERTAIFVKETGVTKWFLFKWNMAVSSILLVLIELYF